MAWLRGSRRKSKYLGTNYCIEETTSLLTSQTGNSISESLVSFTFSHFLHPFVFFELWFHMFGPRTNSHLATPVRTAVVIRRGWGTHFAVNAVYLIQGDERTGERRGHWLIGTLPRHFWPRLIRLRFLNSPLRQAWQAPSSPKDIG
jgi:hypothetical protein